MNDFIKEVKSAIASEFDSKIVQYVEAYNIANANALVTTKIGRLTVDFALDRGKLLVSLSSFDGTGGSAAIEQIYRQYKDTGLKPKGDLNSEDVVKFIAMNLKDLEDDFAALSANIVPPRLQGVQFTPPLAELNRIMRASVEAARAKRLPWY